MRKLAVLALAAVGAIVVFAQDGGPYEPYSYFPAMGHSSDSLKDHISPDQTFEENASVTDTDQWRRTSDGAIVTLANPKTTIVDDIQSGAKQSVNNNYDSATGKHDFIYTIKASHTPGTYYDTFAARDQGTPVIPLCDPNEDPNVCMVIIDAPAPGGPPTPTTTGGTTGG